MQLADAFDHEKRMTLTAKGPVGLIVTTAH